jgi:hypothetical protein
MMDASLCLTDLQCYWSLRVRWLQMEKRWQDGVATLHGMAEEDTGDEASKNYWSNGWASGRMTSTMRDSTNSVMRL